MTQSTLLSMDRPKVLSELTWNERTALMDDLRCEIWDFLYRTNQPQSVETLARHLASDEQMIRAAIDHDWFDVMQDLIGVATTGEVKNEPRNEPDRSFLQN